MNTLLDFFAWDQPQILPLIETCRHSKKTILQEETYKDIISAISSDWLPYRDYSHLVKFVKYQGYKNGTLKFFVPNKFNGWNNYIQFKEWDEQVQDGNISAVEAARLLLWGGNLRLHCNCPAYHFYGLQYIQTQHNVAIVPENRFPSIRNPNTVGFCCKHQIRTLKTLPFHLGDMAAAIKAQRAVLGVEYMPTSYS